MFEKININLYDGPFAKPFVFLTNGKSQLDLAIQMVKKSKFKFVIYTNMSVDSLINIDIPKNVIISSEWRSVIAIMPSAKGALTTVGHYSPVLSGQFKKLLSSIATLGVPLIEVPHGLFQWGINSIDDSKILDLASTQFGAGTWFPSIADEQLFWYGDRNSVGYPRNNQELNNKAKIKILPKFTIITSNLNWFVYSDECRRIFINSVIKFALKRPREMFIWCMHPAERSTGVITDILVDSLPSNIFIYGIDKDVYFEGVDSTEELIRYSEYGISTVSTCILDYEINDIPVFVYNNDGVKNLIDRFVTVSTFSNSSDLEAKPIVLSSGFLESYNVDIFDDLISKFTKEYAGGDIRNFLSKEF